MPASDCGLAINVHVSFAFLNRPDPNVLRQVAGRDSGTKLPKQPAFKTPPLCGDDAQCQMLPSRFEPFIFLQFCKLLELVIHQVLACCLMPSLLVGTLQDIDVKD